MRSIRLWGRTQFELSAEVRLGLKTPDKLEYIVDVNLSIRMNTDSAEVRPIGMNVSHRHVCGIKRVGILKRFDCRHGPRFRRSPARVPIQANLVLTMPEPGARQPASRLVPVADHRSSKIDRSPRNLGASRLGPEVMGRR